MEELRSTEILDREIQEDARRKADKILKANEVECGRIAADVALRVAEFRAQKEREYDERTGSCRRDSEAAIPLEKQRKLVEFIDTAVQENLDRWFDGIGEQRRLSLFAGLLERFKSVLGESKLNIVCSGYSSEAIGDFARGIFGGDRIGTVTVIPADSGEGEHVSDGLTVETEDRRILCRATRDEIREELLSIRREELSAALFGGRLEK